MARNSNSIFRRLVLLTQPFAKQRVSIRLGQLDKLIDKLVQKNDLVAIKLHGWVEQLDVENYPTTTSAPKYRWQRLIKDLDALSDRLQHLKQCLHKKQVRKALYMFTFDLWPLALKISCRNQIETGIQGDWIDDTTALYILCEKYADEVERATNVIRRDESVAMRDRGENTMRLVEGIRPVDEEQIYDNNNGKRAS